MGSTVLDLFCVPYSCSLKQCLPSPLSQRVLHGGGRAWPFKPFQCLTMATKVSNHMASRRSADYQPSIWSDDFLKSIKNDHLDELHEERAKKLKEVVRIMIGKEDESPLTILELIDDIQRLGLGYHFEMEISKALHRIMCLGGYKLDVEERSLHATSLRFRLLRQHGYEVTQDVFKKFKDQNGDFMACLSQDVKGLLSLYEASYLAFEEEHILDEAKAFTTLHLKVIKGSMDKKLEEQLDHALELPLHHRMPRLEARWYIDAYSRREDSKQTLLELAKVDFNMVQSTLQRELQEMSRWWKNKGLANKLSFIRDRVTECFFWTVGMIFEPQFSDCRKGLTKVTALITTIDDVYDIYGSLDELELFTNAVERWDINAVKTLPDYMKLCFLALYNTVNEMAYDILKETGEISIHYLTKAWADLCKAFLLEAKWNYNKDNPTLNAYLDNAWISVSGVVILVHAYFLMTKNITKEALESLETYHDLLQWSSMIFRLSNDLGTSKAEIERGETINSILCYMHENGNSEELSREHIRKLTEEMWKKMNKDGVANSPFERPFIETTINLARIAQCTYQYGDGHGAPDVRSKNRVLSLIIEPITLT